MTMDRTRRFSATALATVLWLAATSASAQQTMTFDNATPPLTIPLTDPSTVTFEDNGNVHAQCQLDGTRCVGTAPTSCPTPPGTSLLAGDFSTVADGNGRYSPGTTLKLFPSVTGAEICTRITSPGTPAGSGWTGNVNTGLTDPVAVTVGAANAQYDFSLRCYGAGGFQTSAVITVRTNNDVVTPPANCTTSPGGTGNFVLNTQYDEFTDIPYVTTPFFFIQPFPNTGGQLGRWTLQTGQYGALRFTVPSDPAAFAGLARSINWQSSQVGGAADTLRTYISVTQCPGDFRVPAAGTAPAGDTTLALGCRNLRPGNPVIGISYEPTATLTPSTNLSCKLKLGGTYYFNMILANPYDGGGITPGEQTCASPDATQCGIQFRAE